MFNFRQKHTNPSLILMYHRINTALVDTWQLSVAPDNFAGQMEVLTMYQVVSLQQILKDLKNNSVPPNRIAISFDDGYLDNFKYAKPELEKYDYPATFFLTNLARTQDTEFWWDALEHLLLENNDLPARMTLTLGQQYMEWDLAGDWSDIIHEKEMESFASWLPWKTPPSTRHALFVYLSEWIKGLPFHEQQAMLAQLYAQCGRQPLVREPYKLMDEQQISELNRSSRFEIGGHSAGHTALGKFPAPMQNNAITENKAYLEAVTGVSPKGYAYAHGSYNPDSIKILKKNGFQYACATTEGAVNSKSDMYALPRCHVKNWGKADFSKALEQWLG